MENKLKKISIILTIIFITSLCLDLLLNISYKYFNGYYLLFLALIFAITVLSVYSYFIISDISKNKFFYLKSLNYLATVIGFITFIYWTFIKPDALHLLFPTYTILFVFFNNLLMSVIYYIKKTGNKYIYYQWFLMLISILIYLFLPKIFYF